MCNVHVPARCLSDEEIRPWSVILLPKAALHDVAMFLPFVARTKRMSGGPSASHTVSRLRHSPFALTGGKAASSQGLPAAGGSQVSKQTRPLRDDLSPIAFPVDG